MSNRAQRQRIVQAIVDSSPAWLGVPAANWLTAPKMPPIRPKLKAFSAKKKNKLTSIARRYGNKRLAIKQELLALDLAFVNSDFTIAGVVTLLNPVVNGTDTFNRYGRKIYMKSVHVRGCIQNAATSVQDELRLMIIYDRQPNGVLATSANILQDSTVGAATTSLSHLNLNNRDRFLVLRDMVIQGPACTNTAGVLTNYTIPDPVRNSLNVNMFIKLNTLETVYNGGNAGTSADQSTGSLLMLTMSAAASAKWTFAFQSRLRFTD